MTPTTIFQNDLTPSQAHLPSSLHLTAGAHQTISIELLQHCIMQLGQPLSCTDRHVVWTARPKHELSALFASIHQAKHDVAYLPSQLGWRDFSVLAMDMDSTLINIECIDEIADYCGKKEEVAAITEAAMRGEITDFNDSLRRRVALLKGLPLEVLQAVLDERLCLNQGAEFLITAAHQHQLDTVLVSGGFTFFTDAMHQRLGLTHSKSNVLNHNGEVLDGTVQTPIVNAQVKRETVESICNHKGVTGHHAIAMGDGSNDLEMMSIAGLSVAYHAKPAVEAKATATIKYGGLDTLAVWLEDLHL